MGKDSLTGIIYVFLKCAWTNSHDQITCGYNSLQTSTLKKKINLPCFFLSHGFHDYCLTTITIMAVSLFIIQF